VGGKRVDLKNITMPLLNFYGKYDHLVPPEACELLTGKIGSKDATDVCLDTGHIGIYVSSKCQKEFAPKIGAWLKERDSEGKKSPKKKSAAGKTVAGKTAAKSSTRKKTSQRPAQRGDSV